MTLPSSPKQLNSIWKSWSFLVRHCAGLYREHKDEEDERDCERALRELSFMGAHRHAHSGHVKGTRSLEEGAVGTKAQRRLHREGIT